MYLNRIADLLLKTLILIIIIIAFVPLAPNMPAPGVDSSWALGLNQAIAQGLSFGKEIIFTLGPYSSIYTKSYHPQTDWMMVGGSLYLACSYWLALIILMKGIKRRWTIFLGISLLGMIYARDSLFFSYPLIVGLACYKIICPQESIKDKWIITKIALLFAPFGLLALVKGSLLILCCVIVILCSLFFVYYKKNSLAFIGLFSPITTLILFWLGAGQHLDHLSFYIMNTFSMASNFTEAMSTQGNRNEIIMYLLSSLLILLTIFCEKKLTSFAKLFLLCVYIIFLFLSFKTAFTRHLGHAYISSTSILLAALLLPYLFRANSIIPALLFAVITTIYINGQYTKISMGNNLIASFTTAWYGVKTRITEKNSLNRNYNLIMDYLKNQVSFPVLTGTTDIYSYNQTYLISSKLNWSPRPIFQSYSAFSPVYAQINKEHLLHLNKPDNIIFKIEPIDKRIPSMEDGASWPILINNYQPIHRVNDFLILHAKKEMHIKPMTLINIETHTLGETILVPDAKNAVYVEIHINPTIYGQLAILFFKPHSLIITVELENNIKKQYRLIANMAKSGFLLSPLIENTNEFALLYQEKELLNSKKVKSLLIYTNSSQNWHWSNNYTIIFKSIN